MASRTSVRAVLVAALFVAGPSLGQGNGNAYDEFNRLCIQHFGAEREDEVYRKFGQHLKMTPEGAWSYISETSACLAWQTNLPAKTYVEYGETTAYGRRTAEPERHLCLHLHYLTGLKPDATCQYRLVSVDERGNKLVGPTMTFTTKSGPNAVRIPGGLKGPPYVLDRSHTTYLLTQDLTADSTALNIAADGITLDLGGYTVTYDDKAGAADPTADERLYGWHATQNPCGIRTADGRRGIRIVNGTIKQGRGNGASRPHGYIPLFLRRPRDAEVAGLTVTYAGSQVSGIVVNNAYEGAHVHHNVIQDNGTELFDRHRGLDGIAFDTGNVETVSKCHHNLIKRTRHRGITVRSNNDIFANEIYVDSFATNSYGIMYYDNRGGSRNLSLHGNRIFGTGFHPIGIGSGQGWSDVKVIGNFVQMQGTKFERRWVSGVGGGDPEGQRSPVNGVRLQRPRRNVEHSDNLLVVKGFGEGCEMRGLWLVPDQNTGEGIVFRNNVIKLLAEDNHAAGYAITCCGSETEKPVITLEKNTVITNIQHVQCGDSYGFGKHYRFLSNTFVRTGNDPRYKTIRLGWQGWKYESFGHLFIDTKLEGGASFESVSFEGARAARYDFAVGWRLEIQTEPGASVAITDNSAATVFSGNAPHDGTLTVPLIQFVCKPDGKVARTPHTVSVSRHGRTARREVTLDKSQTVEVRP
ncbi:MAG: hypothetical protein FJ279_07530 [Planctomycetes bacterium]|nr:hypothetical protein [Planctomycetota bacterium]MBM4079382.1 hypothetical protein [Planctomycetota bacterium]